jgi:hypothetical protein
MTVSYYFSLLIPGVFGDDAFVPEGHKLDEIEVRNRFLQYHATLVKIALFHSICSISHNVVFCLYFSRIQQINRRRRERVNQSLRNRFLAPISIYFRFPVSPLSICKTKQYMTPEFQSWSNHDIVGIGSAPQPVPRTAATSRILAMEAIKAGAAATCRPGLYALDDYFGWKPTRIVLCPGTYL